MRRLAMGVVVAVATACLYFWKTLVVLFLAGLTIGAAAGAGIVFGIFSVTPFRRTLIAVWNEIQVRAYNVPETWRRKKDAA